MVFLELNFLCHRQIRPIFQIGVVIPPSGPSKNDVTHFLRFLAPPSPFSLILLNRLMESHYLMADRPSPFLGDVIYGWPHLLSTNFIVIFQKSPMIMIIILLLFVLKYESFSPASLVCKFVQQKKDIGCIAIYLYRPYWHKLQFFFTIKNIKCGQNEIILPDLCNFFQNNVLKKLKQNIEFRILETEYVLHIRFSRKKFPRSLLVYYMYVGPLSQT